MRSNNASWYTDYDDVSAVRERHCVSMQIWNPRLQPRTRHIFESAHFRVYYTAGNERVAASIVRSAEA